MKPLAYFSNFGKSALVYLLSKISNKKQQCTFIEKSVLCFQISTTKVIGKMKFRKKSK